MTALARVWWMLVMIPSVSFAQGDIPVGTWRMHISYSGIRSVAPAGTKVYASARNGVMVLDRADNSLTTYSKLNGLKGSVINALQYDAQNNKLLIAYADGKLDVIDNQQQITTFDPTKNSTLTGSAAINHITLHNNLAYLAADYGVVVFDPQRMQVKETWRDLGADGSTLRIVETAFKNDSVFLATDNGVIAGNLNTNLLDFTNWKRFNTGDLAAPIRSVATFNNNVYAAIDGKGIYNNATGTWALQNFLQGQTFQSLDAGANSLYISAADGLWTLAANGMVSRIESPLITTPNMAVENTDGTLWVGDEHHALLAQNNNTFTNYVANSPANSAAVNLRYLQKSVYAVAGGYTSSFAARNQPGNFDTFTNGSWLTTTSAMHDLTDVAFDGPTGKTYLSSFGAGVEMRDANGTITRYDQTNSSLMNAGGGVNITALATSPDGLWAANYGAAAPLHLLSSGNTWKPFAFPYGVAKYPTHLATDFYGAVWMVINPAQGGGLVAFNQTTTTYLTDIAGAGGLPSRAVRSIATDRDGLVWVGTDLGVAYFIDPAGVYTGKVDAIKPIYENRFLLKDDKVTALAVDGGNRKWMGTERGVWLFGPSGETLVYNFTADNSPLLSNIIDAITIHQETGEVFFATREGIVSFRADATESTSTFQSAKIFPNPVTSDFNGTVGISGLATDAIVKITDVSGKLIFQTQANGGTASWNVRDYTGKRPATGIYLVLCATADGTESMVGKIAVVN